MTVQSAQILVSDLDLPEDTSQHIFHKRKKKLIFIQTINIFLSFVLNYGLYSFIQLKFSPLQRFAEL